MILSTICFSYFLDFVNAIPEFEKLMPREDFLNPDFFIVEHPTIDLTHRLTVKIFKSNGDKIITVSEQIFWE